MTVRSTRVVGYIFIFLTCLACQGAIAQTCKPNENTAFGEWFDASIQLKGDQRNQSFDSGLGAQITSLKLLLQWKSGAQRDWRIIIRDLQLHVLATLGPQDFVESPARPGTRGRWTGRLPVARVVMDLVGPNDLDAVVEVPSGLAYSGAPGAHLFSIQGPVAQWGPLYSDPSSLIKRAGDPVGMLVSGADNDGQKQSWCCSGSMISDQLFLTNWHCGGVGRMSAKSYWNDFICDNTVVDLGWDDSHRSRQYSCVGVPEKDEKLDFAFIRLQPVVGIGGVVGQPPRARIAKNTTSDNIFMVHHALCLPKLVSTCTLNIAASAPGNPDIFRHTCDTEHGASGAPIFDETGHLVGLHHSGFARDANCSPTDRLNKATRMSAIIDYLKSRNSSIISELGIDE
jgi:hypothetical protein